MGEGLYQGVRALIRIPNMHFFLDESGKFTANDGISVVCTLAIPSKAVANARGVLKQRTADWPRKDGELKSGSLKLSHLTALTDILFRFNAVMHCVACNVAGESASDVTAHKSSQCEDTTRHLTPEHSEGVKAALWSLRRDLEAMPPQLYIQSVAMRELVCTALEEVSMYFSQRIPKEIGKFNWLIDAKDSQRVTRQENWWRQTLGPIVETRSEHQPFGIGSGPEFNYKYFHRNFELTKELWRPEQPRRTITGLNIRAMIMDHVSFIDSKQDVLIQAIDVLAGFIRRTLRGEITDADVVYQLGRLQIARRRGKTIQAMQFISLSKSPESPEGITKIIRAMARSHRSMLAK